MTQTTDTRRRVTTTDASNLDNLLNAAVEGLIPPAFALNHGIRVTRIGAGDYVVETAADIACGYTVNEQR